MFSDSAAYRLQIFIGLSKYARNLRRFFWCTLGLTAFCLLLFGLKGLKLVDDKSPIIAICAGGVIVSAIAYLWIKADCLNFDLNLSITKWLNIAFLLDVTAMLVRMVSRWGGWQDIGRLTSSILASLGLLLFIYFLHELSKYTQQQHLLRKARWILSSYALGYVLVLILVFFIKAKLVIAPWILSGLLLSFCVLFLIAWVNLLILLWRLPPELKTLANNILLQDDPESSSNDQFD